MEEYLRRIDAMVHNIGLDAYSTHEEDWGKRTAPIKFRWLFTFFYTATSLGSLALLIQQIVAES